MTDQKLRTNEVSAKGGLGVRFWSEIRHTKFGSNTMIEEMDHGV